MVSSEAVPSPLWGEPPGTYGLVIPAESGPAEGMTQPLATHRCNLFWAMSFGVAQPAQKLGASHREFSQLCSCCVLWFVRNMMHYPSSLSCCLCPVTVLRQRAVTHLCPPARRMVGPGFSKELGHYRVQSTSLSLWSDGLTCHSR